MGGSSVKRKFRPKPRLKLRPKLRKSEILLRAFCRGLFLSMFCRHLPAIFVPTPTVTAGIENGHRKWTAACYLVKRAKGGNKMNGVQPLRVGLIGAGYQGREHLAAVEHLVKQGRLSLAG